MATNNLEQRIESCRVEIDEAIEDLHKRLVGIEGIAETLGEIYKSTQHTDRRLTDLMLSVSSYIAKQEQAIKGFPNDDPDGHRKAHEAMITSAQRKAAFYSMMLHEVSKWSIFGVLTGLATAVWLFIKTEVHK